MSALESSGPADDLVEDNSSDPEEVSEDDENRLGSEEPALVANWARNAVDQMDATRVAELYMARMAAADDEAPLADATPKRTAVKVVKSGSRPNLKAPPGVTVKRRQATPSNDHQPQASFAAEVRCAVRVGNNMVWAAERDGSLVVRDSQTGKTIERLISGHDWERILCIEPVGHGPNGTVWCGTEAGPIIVFDRARKLLLEARQHSGCVHCICAAPRFVVSGGSDRRVNMWHPQDGKLMKTLSGHTGGVRCVLVLGMQIWTGSDDTSLRVWDAAHGVFQLETQPCRAVLSGHTGAVHSLVAHSEGVLSCASDGTIRCWKASGGGKDGSAHACLREVYLNCGPVYQLVPMGRNVWAAGADGSVHTLDGVTLEPSGPSRLAHTGFVSGLCALPARTARQCWSFSTSDGRVCRWKTDELESQLTSERAALLAAERDSLAAQLTSEHEARSEEQRVHADRAARDADIITGLRTAERELMGELETNMALQEKDLQEAERLRELLAEREAELAQREAEAQRRLQDMKDRAEAAEAEAMVRGEVAAARLDALERSEAQAQCAKEHAERLAVRVLASAVRALGGSEGLRARRARRLQRAAAAAAVMERAAADAAEGAEGAPVAVRDGREEENEEQGEAGMAPAMTQPARFWDDAAASPAESDGDPASLVSTAPSLETLLGDSRDLPTVQAIRQTDASGGEL